MTALIRSSALRGFDALCRTLGLDARQRLRLAGLPPGALADDDALIPFTALMKALESTAQAARCPDLGLRLAQRQDIGVLGPVAVLIRHAPTLGDALQLASRHVFVHSPAVHFTVAETSDERFVDLCIAIDLPQRPPCTQTLELSLGLAAQCIRVLGQGQVRPVLAQLPHARIAPPAAYARAFGCECRFDAPLAALRIAAAELQRPLSEHDPLLQQLAQSYLDQHFGVQPQLLAQRVRSLVRRFLGDGRAAQADIAGMLALHPRTLQRRLADEGERFGDIVESVRKEQLIELLGRAPAPPLSQVALMLGYSEQAALTRSCRRWFGCPPRALGLQQAPRGGGTRRR
jgi:AraC-like DNA-binding protein